MSWTKNKTYLLLITALLVMLWVAWNLHQKLALFGNSDTQSLPLSPEFESHWQAFYLEQKIEEQETFEGWRQRISNTNPNLWDFWLKQLHGLSPELAYSLLKDPPVDSLIKEVTNFWTSSKPEIKYAKASLFDILSRHHSLQKLTKKYHLNGSSTQTDSPDNGLYFRTEKPLKIIGMIGLFQYQTALTDSTIWVGLDMFMNENYRYYPSVEHLYQYQTRRTNPCYLPVSVARTLAEDWVKENIMPASTHETSLLDQIIMEGKILACVRWMLPEVHDSLLLGYSSVQWDWIQKNQNKVWRDLVSKDLLFSRDPAVVTHYLCDGPFSSGYPPQSPPAIGLFLGDVIVQKWLKNIQEPESLPPWERLLKLKDIKSSKVLRASEYKGRA